MGSQGRFRPRSPSPPLNLCKSQKNPRAHKNKIGTSPPPHSPKYPPPPQNEECYGPAERMHFFEAPIKLAQPFPAPELRTKMFGPHPQYGWDFPEEIPENFRKDPGNALRAFPRIPLESTAGIPQTLQFKTFEGSRAFPEFPPPSTAGDASFSRSGSGEGLSELVMEFPAVLGVFLNFMDTRMFLIQAASWACYCPSLSQPQGFLNFSET